MYAIALQLGEQSQIRHASTGFRKHLDDTRSAIDEPMFHHVIPHCDSLTLIIIMAGMAVVYVAGYIIEERRRWSVITASARGQCPK